MTRAARAAPAPRAPGDIAGRRTRSRRAALAVAGGTLLATAPVLAQYEPGPTAPPLTVPGASVLPGTTSQQAPTRQNAFSYFVEVEGTLTSNANFDRVRSDKQPDFVTRISPGFHVEEYGAHSSLVGTVTVPMYFYARTGGDNNRVLPDASLRANLDALERRFTLDAGVEVHRQFLTPLGATPSSGVSNTLNEYSAGTYHVTPAFHGDLSSNVHYELHDANTWTNVQGAPGQLSDAYTNEAAFNLTREPTPFGWGVEYTHTRVNFKDQLSPTLTTEIARLRGDYAPMPDFRVFADVGYENNHYSFSSYEDAIYGVGARWRPSGRTSLDASWEHRFFGSAWHLAFDTRTPLTVWSISSSRDVSTYPQQLATFNAGQDVSTLLNSLFLSRIPDPVARQQAIANFIQLYGLPSTLVGPVQLYSQQARLITDTRAVAGFLGARNSVYFTLYRNRNQQVVQTTDAAGLILPFNDTTQTGTNLVWSSRLTSVATLTGTVDYNHATDNSSTTIGEQARTNNLTTTLTVITPISPLTDFHYGVRYQFTHSNVAVSTDEAAIYAGIVHRFR